MISPTGYCTWIAILLLGILSPQVEPFQPPVQQQHRNVVTTSLHLRDGINGNMETVQWMKQHKNEEPPPAFLVTPNNSNDDVGFVRAMVVAVPLVLKLTVVLGIKFLMDLIVFPLLFLYRFLMLIKTKTVTLFQTGSNERITTTTEPKSTTNGTAT